MGRPKGATKQKTLFRDAYNVSMIALAQRARDGDSKAQELFLMAVGSPGVFPSGPFSPLWPQAFTRAQHG